MSDRQTQQDFDMIDTNHNGLIEIDEYVAWRMPAYQAGLAAAREAVAADKAVKAAALPRADLSGLESGRLPTAVYQQEREAHAATLLQSMAHRQLGKEEELAIHVLQGTTRQGLQPPHFEDAEDEDAPVVQALEQHSMMMADS